MLWVYEYDIDGYRCDVAGLVPLEFWDEVRYELERIKPEILLLAEGDHPGMHLQAFDATYDWDLYFTLKDIKTEKTKAEDALDVILKVDELFPQNALRLRFIENHDMERSMQLLGDAAFKPYAALIFTIPGIPLIYNGQEIGSKIRLNIFEKDHITWSDVDSEVLSFYKYLINLRRNRSQFSEGKLIKIDTDDSKHLVAFARIINENVGLVVLNFSGKRIKAKLYFSNDLKQKRAEVNFKLGQNSIGKLFKADLFEITLEPYEAQIYLSE